MTLEVAIRRPPPFGGNPAAKGEMAGGPAAMAIWTRKRWCILLAALAVIPLGLLAALAFAPTGTAFYAYLLALWILQRAFAPWTVVEVPLPEGAGELKYYRKSDGLFQGSYYRRIEIRYPYGRRISSDLMVNHGGTMMFLHWQSANADGGPFLWLQDLSGVTVINLAVPCLADDSKPTYAIPRHLQCRRANLPVSNDWRYFGRIAAAGQGLEFVAEETWPPDIELARRFASRRIPLPAAGWDFQINRRPDPYDPRNRRYWITLAGPEGARVTAWFSRDNPLYEDDRPVATAPLFWYPATDSQGPYVRIGRLEGSRFGASTLIDLAAPRAYRAFRVSKVAQRFGDEGDITAKTPIEDLWTGYVSYSPPADHFLLKTYDAGERRLPPLPDGVRNVTPQAIGTIDLDKMTFSPQVFLPIYPD